MRWPDDLSEWPLSDHSRRTPCRPHTWHIQEAGSGDTLVLLHGAGGATQSWRALFPLLAQDFHVVAIDLPGQGFSDLGTKSRCGLSHMAEDLIRLIDQEGWKPTAYCGHSAGAALAMRIAMDRPAPVLGINPALENFRGVAGWLFPVLAKLLAMSPLSATLFATTMTPARVRQLVEGTGSRLNPEGLALYHRLAKDRGHVAGTLLMMAQWSLNGLLERLPGLSVPVRLLAGQNDRAVPPQGAQAVCAKLPDCQIEILSDLGHLMHEEAPERVATWIRDHLFAPQGLGTPL